MKKLFCSVVAAIVALSCSFCGGAVLAAEEPVYFTLDSSEPISITENGTYRIDGEFTGDGTSTAITISNDVTDVDFSFYNATVSGVTSVIETNAYVQLDIGFSKDCSLTSSGNLINAPNADLAIGAAGTSEISMTSESGKCICCNTLNVNNGTFNIIGGVGNAVTTTGDVNSHDGFISITGGQNGYAVDCNDGNGKIVFDDLTVEDDVKLIAGSGITDACRCETEVLKESYHTVIVSDDGVTWYEV